MDKNVSSVNLDELKEAREALDKERGVETDPNMYNSYDAERHNKEKEQSHNETDENDNEVSSFGADDINSTLNSEKDDDTIIIDNLENNETELNDNKSETDNDAEDNEINFSIYDTFSDFEVNNENKDKNNKEIATADNFDEDSVSIKDNKIDSNENSINQQNEVNSGNLDDFLQNLDNILSKNADESNDLKEDDFDEKLEKYSVDSKEKTEENDEYNTEILTDFSKLSELSNELSAETEEVNKNNSKKIKNEDLTEKNNKKQSVQKSENGIYKNIDTFNFIDIMATEEFKEADNFSYLLGKNEDGNLVFGNIKDTCGTAFFTRNQENVFSSFSSILISLLLKNSPDNMQFVVCDAMFDSEFDVFENSSYMYFNRVAKNNREIVDTLLELSKEIETRYNNLVFAGVKSIGAYNLQAEERGTEKMPYIVLFLNNYAKMAQFLDNERINTCLYNILKFGRIAGIYVMLASAGEIERNEINFNLPTRVAYKTDDELESVNALGFKGAENLSDSQDFLYSTVFDEDFKHLKVASLTKKEVELIIENLEN